MANADPTAKNVDSVSTARVVKIVLEGVGKFPATELGQKYFSAFLTKHLTLSQKDCRAWFFMGHCLQFARGPVIRSTPQGQHVYLNRFTNLIHLIQRFQLVLPA